MNVSLVLAADGVLAAPRVPQPRPGLARCAWLALLLHLWLVALVGTTPGPDGQPGEGWGGTLRIRLEGPGPADSPGQAHRPLPHTGPSGRAPEPRFGGAVREAPPQPSPEPGAAQLGTWGPRPDPAPEPERLRPAAALRSGADGGPAAPPPALTRTEPRAPALAPPLPTAAPEPAPAAVPEVAAPDAPPAPSTAPRLAPHDTVEVPVLERPERAQRDIAHTTPTPAAALRPQPAPAPQRDERLALPQPAPAAVQPLRPTAPIAPRVDPAPAAAEAPLAAVPPPPEPAPAPALAPQPAAVAVPEPTPPAATAPARTLAAPAPPSPDAATSPPQAAPPAPVSAAPPPLTRAPPALTTVRPVEAFELPQAALPDLALPAVRAPDAPVRAAPSGGPRAGGQPDAGARVGADRATPPSASASAPLRLELPAARAPQAGLLNPRVLNLVPPPPERKSPLAEGIEKAARPDCRKAYSGMGPLAVLPLAVDALRDGGCRW